MKIENVPFTATYWNELTVKVQQTPGGQVATQSFVEGNLRVRVVEYGPGYVSDHWCQKGHVLYVLEGELETELSDGRVFKLPAGSSYQVADDVGAHRSRSPKGARLLIVD